MPLWERVKKAAKDTRQQIAVGDIERRLKASWQVAGKAWSELERLHGDRGVGLSAEVAEQDEEVRSAFEQEEKAAKAFEHEWGKVRVGASWSPTMAKALQEALRDQLEKFNQDRQKVLRAVQAQPPPPYSVLPQVAEAIRAHSPERGRSTAEMPPSADASARRSPSPRRR